MLHDCNQAVGNNGSTNLYSHSVFGFTPEFLDFQVLFQSFEEKFNLPSVLVKVCNPKRRNVESIGEKREFSVLFCIIVLYQSEFLCVLLCRGEIGQKNFRIGHHVLRHPSAPLDASVLWILLSSYYKERFVTMDSV